MGQAVFHPVVFDRLVERFPDDARLFPPPEPGDAIAALFVQALELITRTGRSLRLATPEGRRCLGESAAAFYRLDNVDLLVRLRDLIDESPPAQFEQENEALRDKVLVVNKGDSAKVKSGQILAKKKGWRGSTRRAR